MQQLDDFAPFSPAETKVLEGCASGDRITLGDGEMPKGESPETDLRAEFLRHILLGGAGAPVLHEKGLRLRGGRIVGVLDLQGADCPRDITLSRTVIAAPLGLVNARLRGLHLSACRLAGLSADNATFSGSVFLRGDSLVEGELSLAGARIAGDLQLCGVEIRAPGMDALFAPSLRVEGSVFLGNYPYSDGITTLTARGMVFLSSASVGHDVFVTHCAISPHEDPIGDAVFGATEEHGRDMALSLARARIGGILYFQANQISRGIVNLAGAEAARLTDEPTGPGASYPIRLDGFRYGDFSRHADLAISARLDWLERRPPDTPFTAQPYEHLADVLRRLGHREDARRVLMRKEWLLREENRRLMRAEGRWAALATAWPGDLILWASIGYGYRPGRAVLLAVALVAGLGWFFGQCWKAGDMAPNAAPILVSAPWIAATESHPGNPGAFWAAPGQAGQDWETFHPYAYAADVVIPLIALGQEAAWAPSTSRSDWGRAGWWMRWFAKAVGWIVTALGAAAITGVIRKD